LHTYCFLAILDTYITHSFDLELLNENRIQIRKDRRVAIQENRDLLHAVHTEMLDENAAQEEEDLEEIDIILGNQETLQKTVASLLVAFLNIEIANKRVVNITYQDIADKERRVKEAEADKIVSYFGKMNVNERRVENLLKTYKIGRWNVGMQKGLVTYDKATFDREQNELLRQINEGEVLLNNDGGIDEVDNNDEDEEENHEEEAQLHDVGGFDEAFYPEDRDNDGFEDS